MLCLGGLRANWLAEQAYRSQRLLDLNPAKVNWAVANTRLQKICKAIETAGIEFIDENGGGREVGCESGSRRKSHSLSLRICSGLATDAMLDLRNAELRNSSGARRYRVSRLPTPAQLFATWSLSIAELSLGVAGCADRDTTNTRIGSEISSIVRFQVGVPIRGPNTGGKPDEVMRSSI